MPFVKNLFPDTFLEFAEVAICVHCPRFFYSLPLRKTFASIFLIPSYYTAEKSKVFPAHTHTSSLTFFQLNPSLGLSLYIVYTSLLTMLMPFCWGCSSMSMSVLYWGAPKQDTALPSVVSQVLNWQELITEDALSGKKGMFLKSAQIALWEWIMKMKWLYLKL